MKPDITAAAFEQRVRALGFGHVPQVTPTAVTFHSNHRAAPVRAVMQPHARHGSLRIDRRATLAAMRAANRASPSNTPNEEAPGAATPRASI